MSCRRLLGLGDAEEPEELEDREELDEPERLEPEEELEPLEEPELEPELLLELELDLDLNWDHKVYHVWEGGRDEWMTLFIPEGKFPYYSNTESEVN